MVVDTVRTGTEIRDALRAVVLARHGAQGTIDEFWMPRSNARADLVALGSSLDGFEIKGECDTLGRLPAQALAYGRVFDRCTVVVAEKHRDRVATILPSWWGITVLSSAVTGSFYSVRQTRPNPRVDPDTLVRLLWRDEAVLALRRLGQEPDRGRSRSALWNDLLNAATTAQLRDIVRQSLLARDPSRARIPTRRFTRPYVAEAER